MKRVRDRVWNNVWRNVGERVREHIDERTGERARNHIWMRAQRSIWWRVFGIVERRDG